MPFAYLRLSSVHAIAHLLISCPPSTTSTILHSFQVFAANVGPHSTFSNHFLASLGLLEACPILPNLLWPRHPFFNALLAIESSYGLCPSWYLLHYYFFILVSFVFKRGGDEEVWALDLSSQRKALIFIRGNINIFSCLYACIVLVTSCHICPLFVFVHFIMLFIIYVEIDFFCWKAMVW